MRISSDFRSRLKQGQILVSDGATGTNLQLRGLPLGMPSDAWVLENPQAVLQLHRDFIAAGANIILTNTFGAKAVQLKKIGLEGRVRELNLHAVDLARQAAEGMDVWVGGTIGPTGELLKPYGTLEEAEAENEFTYQAQLLVEGGVDLIVIETQYDLAEAKAALRAVRSVTDLPLVCSFSYDRGVRTMMGVRPRQMAEELAGVGADLLGINCGRSLEDNLKALTELRESTDLPIWFKPNAGLPQSDPEGQTAYSVTPEAMGGCVSAWVQAGASVLGGCCGTSPAHLEQIARALPAALQRQM